ncbi:nucleotidyltransferase family protein [Amycolatopsis eburnea]|uniref:Nucleotidyltransferase family protein n=1 Tax=Amycolatopsis eburnea TaxID=2267691 RepID=A0A427TJN9_9PSEU|nr:nucleotidyltransferase family protein [Amycolatopsis eburnea]RSD23802.1 nucleotidyltransferase family protein [Amycolatopsis eburnea]
MADHPPATPVAGARSVTAGTAAAAGPAGAAASATATGAAPRVAGLLLAAGAGRRFGGPKALAELDGEPLVRRALRTLSEAGCTPIRVVLGAAADQVRPLLPDPTAAVYAEDWQTGMGASLRAGLTALTETGTETDSETDGPVAALVHLVDLPWIGPEILTRVTADATPRSIARAAYDGTPGHPVLLGRDWWPEIAATAQGDRGARDWLATRADLTLIECADLGSGHDVDRPTDLPGQSPS